MTNGQEDGLIKMKLRVASMFKDTIPGSELAIIDDAWHMPMIEKPTETSGGVYDSLKRNSLP